MAILHSGFTVNDCRFAPEVGSGADNAGIAVTPIISIAAEHTRLAALDHHLRAVSIVLDFVNPVLPIWRLRSKLWFDEPEFGGYHLAGSLLRLGLVNLIEEVVTSLQVVGQ